MPTVYKYPDEEEQRLALGDSFRIEEVWETVNSYLYQPIGIATYIGEIDPNVSDSPEPGESFYYVLRDGSTTPLFEEPITFERYRFDWYGDERERFRSSTLWGSYINIGIKYDFSELIEFTGYILGLQNTGSWTEYREFLADFDLETAAENTIIFTAQYVNVSDTSKWSVAEPHYWHEIERTTRFRKYKLIILDEGVEVFSRIDENIPEYVNFPSFCPEGTCEVVCDGGICCYGSDGNVVETIEI